MAKLPRALPPKARRLTATIKTEDPAGPLVEYALLALDQSASHKPILINGQLDGQPGGFSGWQPIYPDFVDADPRDSGGTGDQAPRPLSGDPSGRGASSTTRPSPVA